MYGAHLGGVVVEKAYRGQEQIAIRQNELFVKLAQARGGENIGRVARVDVATHTNRALAVESLFALSRQASQSQNGVAFADSHIGDDLLELGLSLGVAALNKKAKITARGQETTLKLIGRKGQ
jgi:hypothetical protein